MLEDLGEGVDGSCVCAIPRHEGLYDEAGAYEIEWREEEAGYEVGGDREVDGRLMEGGCSWQENSLEEVVDDGLKSCGKGVVDAGC